MNTSPRLIALVLVFGFFSMDSGFGELRVERLPGEGVWLDPKFKNADPSTRIHTTVWFEDQFLGKGNSYVRRAGEFEKTGRTELRNQVIASLKLASSSSQKTARDSLDSLAAAGKISSLDFFWIVNGFTCTTTSADVENLKSVPGVKKIFHSGPARTRSVQAEGTANQAADPPAGMIQATFDPERFEPLWYIGKLNVDRVWKEFGITGKGTLNVIHDGNFIHSPWIDGNVYHNPKEQQNGMDDDGNGFADDIHGFNFAQNTANLTRLSLPKGRVHPSILHGHECVGIICGRGSEGFPVQPGLAPDSKWAGVIAMRKIEQAVQWAVEQGADTYSMSFSRPNLGEYRSHWRKVMEHGSYCGVHFVSGAGNFAQNQPVPIQMRVPEDIPHAVFAAAGVQQDLSRTPFSSQGPVEWNTEHYTEGRVKKPEVCAFNFRVPLLTPQGGKPRSGANGNSFAGPMFCGTIALMLSANPELKTWETREIIIKTATDVAEEGFDFQTGYGLINAFEAVKMARERK